MLSDRFFKTDTRLLIVGKLLIVIPDFILPSSLLILFNLSFSGFPILVITVTTLAFALSISF